ncbi:hypothetical protein [Burkholderia contaminans]|uniref:hypothetical protein n=1 Tax=Burkholderia contaminans TaxID=488447 RepID=UPI001453CB33|nr:hypothetical protein [Burkholderia contaminans]VWD22425.1 hypothetical protein BCO18442_04020 [Burkholderia contaminans]
MKISIGNFGNVVARPGPQPDASGTAFGVGVSESLASVGRAVAGFGAAIRENDEAQKRAVASLGLAKVENGAHAAYDEISRGVLDGTVSARDAQSLLDARIETLRSDNLSVIDERTREAIAPTLEKLTGGLARNMEGVVYKRGQDDVSAQIVDLGEEFKRSAMRDLPGAVANFTTAAHTLGPQAGWSQERIAKEVAKFGATASYTFADATLDGAAQTGDLDLVRAARERLQGPDGEALDPRQRNALISKGYGLENSIEAARIRAAEKAEREEQARVQRAKDAFESAFRIGLSGAVLSPDAISDTSALVAGTPFEPMFRDLVKMQGQQAQWVNKPIPEQRRELAAMRSLGATPGHGTSPEQAKIVDLLEQTTAAQEAAVRDNAWKAASDRGIAPFSPIIGVGNIGDAQQIIGERMKVIGQVEQWTGKKESPVQPDEAAQVGKLIRALPPDQAATALSSFGSLIQDGDRLTAFNKQLGEKDRTLAISMAYANAKTTRGRQTAELILSGQQALADKRVDIDSSRVTGWRAEIATQLRGVSPDQRVVDDWIEAAFLVKAAYDVQGLGGSVKDAVNLVTGGLYEQRDGSRIPKPWGMQDGEFEKRVGGLQPVDFAQQAPDGNVYIRGSAVALDDFTKQLSSASLVHAGQGRYRVKAGSGFVTNGRGVPIVLSVDPNRPMGSYAPMKDPLEPAADKAIRDSKVIGGGLN